MNQSLSRDCGGSRKEKRPHSSDNEEASSTANTRLKTLGDSGLEGRQNYYSAGMAYQYQPHPPMVLHNNNNLHPYDNGNSMNSQPHPPQNHFHPYSSNSVSPSPHGQLATSQATTPGGMQPLPPGQAKRPYRQRRKDPSCDACRERKVKCDATETTSCNECKSRGVKCQFTKETNRRMSSIKQVQDLEKQVAAFKNKIRDLESRLCPTGLATVSSQDTLTVNVPEIGSMPPRRPQAPPVAQDLSAVRSHIRDYCRGVFKPPSPYRQVVAQPNICKNIEDLGVQLPPNHIGEVLIRHYYETIHSVIPILHWPQFGEMYEIVKAKRDLSVVSPAWASTLFGVFACGTVYTTDPEIRRLYPDNGKVFIEYSRRMTDLFNDEFTIDHARSALLTSIFLTELNCKSAAWTWLGSTVRIAQDIGLHRESGPWAVVEGEMRRRVWWGIYAWDRLLSVELGRVLLIEDRDCDVGLPCALDDHFIHDGGVHMSMAQSHFLLTTIHIVRMISELLRSLQSPVISQQTLLAFDSHFKSCQNVFPVECQIYHPQPLQPRYLSPICQLQNCRIVLHRHNLSTSCPLEVRAAALQSCLQVAKETVHLLGRVRQWEPQGPTSWKDAVSSTATTMVCAHIWRCMLFLCFSALYDDALACAQICATIGDFRQVNIACGRYLYGFLRQLATKIAQGGDLMQDEMMIALVSGDVQGSTESAWIWNGSETGTALNNGASPPMHDLSIAKAEAVQSNDNHRLPLNDERNGWENIQEIIRQLKREKEQREFQHNPPPHSWGLQMVDPIPAANNVNNSSRISIANII